MLPSIKKLLFIAPLLLLFGFQTNPAYRPVKSVSAISVREDSVKLSRKLIHVHVALCDNDSQGIVPVPKKIGNGNDPGNNLYWGCGYGVRTFFTNSSDWELLKIWKNPRTHILERAAWKHRRNGTILVADAWRGARIKDCTIAFVNNIAGRSNDTLTVPFKNGTSELVQLNNAQLVAYVGHNGLMEFEVDTVAAAPGNNGREAILLCCAARSYFKPQLKAADAYPLLWTTNLMGPEAYTLKAAIDGWMNRETGEQIRVRAATAYNQYIKCGMKGAMNLFASGW